MYACPACATNVRNEAKVTFFCNSSRQSAPSSVHRVDYHTLHDRCEPAFCVETILSPPFHSWHCHLPTIHVERPRFKSSLSAQLFAFRMHTQWTIALTYRQSRLPRHHCVRLHTLSCRDKYQHGNHPHFFLSHSARTRSTSLLFRFKRLYQPRTFASFIETHIPAANFYFAAAYHNNFGFIPGCLLFAT